MNEKIIKPGVIHRIYELTKSRKQNHSIETINEVLTAFLDVIENSISIGTSVVLNGYMVIESRHRPQKKIYCAGKRKEITIPEQYRVRIKPGTKLATAAKKYTKQKLGGTDEHYKQK